MPRPVDWRQLCAIARDQIQRASSIDDGEWIDRIKRRLIALHLAIPKPHELTNAIRAVERAGASRTPAPEGTRHDVPEEGAPLTRDEASRALARLGVEASVMKTIPRVRGFTPREVDRRRALRVLAEGIREQIQRCEDAERVVEDLERSKP